MCFKKRDDLQNLMSNLSEIWALFKPEQVLPEKITKNIFWKHKQAAR